MKPAVTYPDVEHALVDTVTDLIEAGTVGVGVPTGWGMGSPVHYQIALDGSGGLPHPIAERSTVRLTVWVAPTTPTGHGSTTQAKELAQRIRGLLLASDEFSQIRPGAGMLPAHDPGTRAELASFTLLVAMRSTPIGS